MKSDKFLFLFFVIIAFQLPSYAYLDPGTGSLVIQVIIAVFAGIACWVKLQWLNIKGFFTNLWKKKK